MKTIEYGKAGSSIFTIEGHLTPTYIFSCVGYLSIQYNYDVPDNTFNRDSFEYITKKEFYTKLREIESNLKVKIYIKKSMV
jgi:hypothetical protein